MRAPASRLTNPESPFAPGQEFGPEVLTEIETAGEAFDAHMRVLFQTEAGEERLPIYRDPRWYGMADPQFAEEARAVGFINGEGRYAVPSGEPGFVPEPVEPVSDEDVERVEELIAAAADMRYALLLRRGW